ncbi:ATP-binding cassette domain-containing protein [Paenibacillus sp. sgz500958]|uniref:ATP-binding cassette domain-containing protein n=1 Tax=Paenibacillus sp. sgz500958 TaxID=3242475 RepID=UPI0036D416EA
MSIYAIEINNLHKSFGTQSVLGGIDLKVPKGIVFALLGPNGAGKTTLINILSTLVDADEGFVRVEGFDPATERNQVKQCISLTGQFAAVDDVLTGEENLLMICRLNGLSAEEARVRTAELLKRFDLVAAARKRVKTYSGGMRRRLDLAVSLTVTRPVLFLDEPTTGLDTRSRRELWDIVLQLKQHGITIFLTTQYLEEADVLADQIAVIENGVVIAQGTAEELKSLVGGEVIELRSANDELIRKIPTNGSIKDIQQILNKIAPGCSADSRVVISRPNMDDVFIALTSTEKEVSSI